MKEEKKEKVFELPEEMKKELEEKLKIIEEGGIPFPPYLWFYTTRKAIQKNYPERSPCDIDKITAGIWWKYTPEQMKGIIERMLKGEDGLFYPRDVTKEEIEEVIKEWKSKTK